MNRSKGLGSCAAYVGGRGLLCLIFPLAVCAQVAPDAGRTMQSIKPLPPPPRPPADLGLPKPAAPPAAPTAGPKLRVQRFLFTGNTVFSAYDLAPVVQRYAGKELSLSELNQAAAAVTVFYRQAGYFLAQAYIPAQESVQGMVRIAVLEGQIGRFSATRDPKLAVRGSVVRGYLAKLKPGMLIEESRLERPLLLLNDLPGVRARANFKPGEAVGRSDVGVAITPLGRRIMGGLDIDNYNSRFTGEYRFSPSLIINNPLRIGDQLTLKFTESHNHGLTIGQFNYSLPVGYWGTRVGVGYTGLRYSLGEEFAGLNFDTLDAHGDAHVASAFLQHPLVRNSALNLYADLSVDYKLFDDRQDLVSFVNERTNKLGRFGLSGDARDELGGGGISTASFSFGVGHLSLDTPAVEAADQAAGAGLNTQGVYSKFNYRVTRQQTLWRQLSLYAGFTGQMAFNNLDSSEKFFLGGPNGVRAYPLFEATGDEGHIVTGELRYLLPQFTAWFPDTSLFGFIDAGWAKINHSPPPGTPDNDRHLRAYGFGFNAAKANNYLLRGTLAWHDGDDPLGDKDRAPRFWFLVSKQF